MTLARYTAACRKIRWQNEILHTWGHTTSIPLYRVHLDVHSQRPSYTSVTPLREGVPGYPQMQCICVPLVPGGRYTRRVRHADNNLRCQAHKHCTLNRDTNKIHCICQEDPAHMRACDVHSFVWGTFGRAFSKGWLHQCNPFERRCTRVPTNAVHSRSFDAEWTIH